MSIVKMKRLRLIGLKTERETLLRLLQQMGCVEFDEPLGKLTDPAWSGLTTRPDATALGAAREQSATIESALKTIKRYSPKQKGGFLSRRPEISAAKLFDDNHYRGALDCAEQLGALERKVTALYAEQSKLKTQKLSLAPWRALDIPLETTSTNEVAVWFGTVSSNTDLDGMEAAVAAATDLTQILRAGRDAELQYLVILCHKSAEETCAEALKQYGFSKTVLRGWTGTAAENEARLDGALTENAHQLEETITAAGGFAGRREELELALDRAGQEIRREDARYRLLDTDSAFLLEGWVPAAEAARLADGMAQFTCCWETADPTPEEYPRVPVKLKNNWLTRPMNMVTEMYSLPAYDGLDPNPLMAPFFILFYGIMMADMGYGLLMMIASIVVLKKVRPKGTMSHFFALLGLCGVTTFLFGAITGGFFGDFLPQMAKIINPDTTFTALPALFTPVNDTLMILIGALALGIVQIFTGMAISLVRKLKRREFGAAIKDEIAWYAVFICIGCAVITGQTQIFITAIVVILLGTQWIGGKGIGGKLLSIGGSLYNNITGYFSDILSYARLMALMLSGAVVAQVFNTLGAIPGNVLIFIVISLVGNSLNFALNLLGCYVHDLRLQCLEYFNRFYQDGGKAFKPLEINTKYVDVSENN